MTNTKETSRAAGKRMSLEKRQSLAGWAFLTPACLLIFIMSFLPILLTAIMSTNGTLQLFDESVNLTKGGPANMSITMSHYIYDLSFKGVPNFGYASALSFVILLLVAILALLQMKVGEMSVILLAMMVPFAATVIPLFQMFSAAGLLNTTAGFILPTLSTPFMIMLFRQSTRSFPKDLIDAARLDGLNEFQIFLRIYFPTMRSTYAAAMTITFMNAWNNYLWPKIIMTDASSITMPMLVANLKSGYVTDYGTLMLGVLLCSLPTIIIFFLLQKSFTGGITGAVKQ